MTTTTATAAAPTTYPYYLGVTSIGALQAAQSAAFQYQQEQTESENDTHAVVGIEQSSSTGGPVSDTIYRALTWAPLGASYNAMFRAWLKLSDNKSLPIETLAKTLDLSVSQVQARFSKLSARIKRVATEDELKQSPKTPLGLLVDIAYGADNSTAHRLTPAGMAAVKRYLGV